LNTKTPPGHGRFAAFTVDAAGGVDGKLGVLDDALFTVVKPGADPVDAGFQTAVGI